MTLAPEPAAGAIGCLAVLTLAGVATVRSPAERARFKRALVRE